MEVNKVLKLDGLLSECKRKRVFAQTEQEKLEACEEFYYEVRNLLRGRRK